MRRWWPPSKKCTRRFTTITSDLCFHRTWLFQMSFLYLIKRELAAGLKWLEMTNGQNEDEFTYAERCTYGVWSLFAWGSHSAGFDVQVVNFLGQRSISFLISTCKIQKQNKASKCDLRLTYLNGACTKIEKPTPRSSPKIGTKGYAVTCKLNMGQPVQIKGKKSRGFDEERVLCDSFLFTSRVEPCNSLRDLFHLLALDQEIPFFTFLRIQIQFKPQKNRIHTQHLF